MYSLASFIRRLLPRLFNSVVFTISDMAWLLNPMNSFQSLSIIWHLKPLSFWNSLISFSRFFKSLPFCLFLFHVSLPVSLFSSDFQVCPRVCLQLFSSMHSPLWSVSPNIGTSATTSTFTPKSKFPAQRLIYHLKIYMSTKPSIPAHPKLHLNPLISVTNCFCLHVTQIRGQE